MRSFRFLLSRRWLLFALVVVALCYSTWWLGEWQFHRLADRKDTNAVVRANEDKAPAPVADVLATGAPVDESDEWRLVTATGTYDADDTVVVRYRTRDGASGVDVVVPLVTSDGTSLLVDRGWTATDNQSTRPSDLPTPPEGEVTVEGWVRSDATGDSTAVGDHSTRSISSAQIGAAIKQPVYGGFVELKSEDGAPAADLEPVEMPELNNGPHFFYGLQWWFFGLLAVFGFGYLAWDERRSGKRTDGPVRETVLADRKRKRNEKDAKRRAVRAAYQKAYEQERDQRARSSAPSSHVIESETAEDESKNAATGPPSTGAP